MVRQSKTFAGSRRRESLQEPNEAKVREPLATTLLEGDVKRFALFLDVDGTLLEIAPTPDSVVVPDRLIELLVRVTKGLDGAVAVITGRKLADIDRMLAPAKLTGAGVHGAELRTSPGGEIMPVAAPIPQDFVSEVIELARHWPRVIAEPKGPGIAIHYRLAPELKSTVERELRERVARHPTDLLICPGRKVFEVIPAGFSKGEALKTLAALPLFRGRTPIMIGDDVGDEPAQAAALQMGGFGLKVSGEHFDPAVADLAGPTGVHAWLERLAERLET